MATEANSARIGNYARILNPQQQNLDAFPRDSHRSPLQLPCSNNVLESATCGCRPYGPQGSTVLPPGSKDGPMQCLSTPTRNSGTHCSATSAPSRTPPADLFGEETRAALPPKPKSCSSTGGWRVWFRELDGRSASHAYDPFIGLLGRLGPRVSRQDYRGLAGCITSITAGFAGNKHEARVRSQAAYRHHYQDVRESGPRERLLEFRLQEGWGPLCEFFGREVPDMPFPHVNKEESNRLAFETIARIGMKRLVSKALVVLTLVAVPVDSWWYYVRRR